MGVAQGIRRIDIVVVVTSVVGRCGLGGRRRGASMGCGQGGRRGVCLQSVGMGHGR